jgi:disulfide bond formation protein DsbB
MENFIKKYALYGVFIISLLAMLTSLYFSNILGWAPCILCWYQRILMYPLVVISVVAIIFKDRKVYRYILPLSIIGILIAIYHNLLYFNILPESAAPCLNGISCTTKYIAYFGFITIPFLSLCAFVAITLLMLSYKKYQND